MVAVNLALLEAPFITFSCVSYAILACEFSRCSGCTTLLPRRGNMLSQYYCCQFDGLWGPLGEAFNFWPVEYLL